jgi:DNA-directed RNA polymerase specialized sigma24 family protein
MVSKWFADNYEDLRHQVLKITAGDELADDLLHECYIEFEKNKNAEKVIENGSAKWFFIRIVLNQWRSNSSRFYKEYKRDNKKYMRLVTEWWDDIKDIEDKLDYDIEKDELINLNFNIIEDLLKSDIEKERYLGFIVMIYFSNDMNFAEVSRLLNVSRSTIRRQFDEATKIILQRMKKLDTKITYNQLPLKLFTTQLLRGYGRGRRY